MKCMRSLFWIGSVWLVYGSGILVVVVGEAEHQERSDPPENVERFVSVTIEMDGSSNDTSRPNTHGISDIWGVIHFTLWGYNIDHNNDPKSSSRHDSDESFVFEQTLSHLCRTIHHEDDEEKTNNMERNEKEDATIQHDSTTKDRALFFLRHACVSAQQDQEQGPIIKRLDRIAARVDMDVTFHPLGSKIRSVGAHGTDATPVRYVAFPVRIPHPQDCVNIKTTNMGHDDDDNNKTYLQSIVPSSVLLRDENTSEMEEQSNHKRMMGQWYSSVPSPFHLAIPADDDSTTLLVDQRVQASISSSLSNQGGMHRPFHHKINLSFPNDSLKKREASIIRMDILLPLSENVYIDMDDPYHDGGTSATACCPNFVPSSAAGNNGIPTQPHGNMSCSIELILPPSSSSSSSSASIFETSVIDVEQPSFASPQHVVLFRLHVTMDATTAAAATTTTKPWLLSDYQIEIEFSNTLHIRYPSPVVLERDSERNPRWLLSSPQERRHVMVHIPKPIILTGTTDGGMTTANHIDKKEKTDVMFVYPERYTSSNILMLPVAAGADEDYWFVVTITLLSSLIGSIIMIRDISRVSIW
eukprot:CAMPEP_0198289314 /NCGR_PEP_ID=MMETSP1449-20131203/7543_1 /TAXON_ID=420275 /ORGANISM="Attheya septentrionalis, Strain CCMP2084" /LENGTH=583 /DNA_ID=CAMNT_0043987623 /DNA_START=169 /DNA_END=1917 /DNA_ORIENTATION=+